MTTITTRAIKGTPLTWNEVDANFNNLNTDKSELASPTFTGTPAAPTAAVGTNTTQLATTAFVNSEIANDAVAKSGDTMTGGLSIENSALIMDRKNDSAYAAYVGYKNQAGSLDAIIGYGSAGFADFLVQHNVGSLTLNAQTVQILANNSVAMQFDQVTKRINTIANFINVPRVPVLRSANAGFASVTTNTPTKLGVVADIDNMGWMSTARYTPQVTGIYEVTVSCSGNSDTNALELAAASIYRNGVIVEEGSQSYSVANPAISARSVVTSLVQCNGTTDYIEAFGRVVGGGTLNLGDSRMHIRLVSS